MSTFKSNRGFVRSVAAVAFVAAAGFAVAAQAGECPAGKSMPNARQPVDFKAVGVTDTTLGAIDLGKEALKLPGHETALPQAHHRPRRHRALAQP